MGPSGGPTGAILVFLAGTCTDRPERKNPYTEAPSSRRRTTAATSCFIMVRFSSFPILVSGAAVWVCSVYPLSVIVACLLRRTSPCSVVKTEYLSQSQFKVQKEGGSLHLEYWIPAEKLAEFSQNI